MARGYQALYNSLITPLQPNEANAMRKGRSQPLTLERDRRLLYRNYFYAHIRRLPYGDVIKILSLQFDLTECRLIQCLTEKHPHLKRIFEERPSKQHLKKLYSWLNWTT